MGNKSKESSLTLNVVTIERPGERTTVTFVKGGTEALATAPEDVIQLDRG